MRKGELAAIDQQERIGDRSNDDFRARPFAKVCTDRVDIESTEADVDVVLMPLDDADPPIIVEGGG